MDQQYNDVKRLVLIDEITQQINKQIQDFDQEITAKSEKELKSREDFFGVFNQLIETRFADQQKSFIDKVDQFKNTIDEFVKGIEIQNVQLQREFIHKSDQVYQLINKERAGLKLNQIKNFKDMLNDYHQTFKSLNEIDINPEMKGSQQASSATADSPMYETKTKLNIESVKIQNDIDTLETALKQTKIKLNVEDNLDILESALAEAKEKKYQSITTSQQAIKVTELLSKLHKIDQDQNKASYDMWKKLGPLTITEICKNCDTELDFENNDIEIIKIINDNQLKCGQFKKGTSALEGIGRQESSDGQIFEGLYINGKLNGYGRVIHIDGSYYKGMFKDHMYHGQGTLIHVGGRKEKGIWKINKCIEQ